MTCRDQRVTVIELDAIQPFERQHSACRSPPVDLGDVVAGLGDHVLAKLGGGCCLALQVQLARRPLLELRHDQPWSEPLQFAAHGFDVRGRPFVGLDRLGEFFLDAGAKDFHGHDAALCVHGLVDLGNRCRADRNGIEALVQLLQRSAERSFDHLANGRKRRRGQVVLKLRQVFGRALPDEVGAGRQRLPELDRRRSDFLKRSRIVGRQRNARAEPGDAHKPAHLRRSQRIVLDPAQGAMTGQGSAPLQ